MLLYPDHDDNDCRERPCKRLEDDGDEDDDDDEGDEDCDDGAPVVYNGEENNCIRLRPTDVGDDG